MGQVWPKVWLSGVGGPGWATSFQPVCVISVGMFDNLQNTLQLLPIIF